MDWAEGSRALGQFPGSSALATEAEHKDELGLTLVRLVCSGRLPLEDAQRAIARDWWAAYHKYVGRAE